MIAWWYWALFALAVLLLAAVPLTHWWHARADRRDAELWKAMWR